MLSGAMGQLMMYGIFRVQQASHAALKCESTMTMPGLTVSIIASQLSTTSRYSNNRNFSQ